MRDLFPDDCFKNKEYGSVDIHQLQAAKKTDEGEISIINEEAFLLTQWLEKGVFTALELEYLSSVTFAIYTKHPLTKEDLLLETYEFKMSYQEDSHATINNVPLVSRETVKSQAAKFIRALTEFSGTLDNLPDERWITLQLKVILQKYCLHVRTDEIVPIYRSIWRAPRATTNRSTSRHRMR
jgi:hypothetical protein